MTTPTTDADRLTQIEEVVDQWRIAEPGNRLTDAEALAKVRALLSGGEPAKVRDESQPPPGWEDSIGGGGECFRCGRDWISISEAWRIYDDEHGYAPQGAPPNPLCPLHGGELECLCGE